LPWKLCSPKVLKTNMAMDNKAVEIIQEAMQIFQRFGIKSISMEELARQLGVSKKTLYQFFADKTELVEKVVLKIAEKQNCDFLKINNENLNALDELFRFYKAAHDMIKDHNPGLEFDLQRFYPTIFKKVRDSYRERMFESTVSNLNKGKAEGFYRQNFDTNIIAKLHMIRIEYLMHSDLVTHDELHSEHFFNEVFKYHLHGILSFKGLEYIKLNYPDFANIE